MHKLLHLPAAFLLAAQASTAPAQGIVGRLDVKVAMVSGCQLSRVGRDGRTGADRPGLLLDFGMPAGAGETIDGVAVAQDWGGALSIICSSSHIGVNAPTLSIDGGSHPLDGRRRMAGPGARHAPYGLFRDPARTQLYAIDAPVQLVIPSAGVAVPIPIYGRVPGATALPDGTYEDIVTITLTY